MKLKSMWLADISSNDHFIYSCNIGQSNKYNVKDIMSARGNRE